MQFVGKKGIAFFSLIVICACGVGFGAGFLVGRQIPKHNFEQLAQSPYQSPYLLDSSTGSVCKMRELDTRDAAAKYFAGLPNQPASNDALANYISTGQPAIPFCK